MAPTRPSRHIPGESGLWILLFGDFVIFALLFMVYLHGRGQHSQMFTESQDTLNRNAGAANTVVLLVSSILVVFAWHSIRRHDNQQLASHLVLGAIGCGLCFIAIKVFEYHQKVAAGLTPATNAFYMYYFVLTGLHLFHVIVGLGVLTALWAIARKSNRSQTQLTFFEGGACFWHMVDLLWIMIFPLIFLVRA
jgi:nitric oxide reductase NorE protein